MTAPLSIKLTKDGSQTLFHEGINEHYHSIHGALAESRHVFITNGLKAIQKTGKLKVLEVGFGTGLNALLTAEWAVIHNRELNYSALETEIVQEKIWKQLEYPKLLQWPDAANFFHQLHSCTWDTECVLSPFFSLKKLHISFHKPEKFVTKTGKVDLIFFDAFAPTKQNDMWEEKGFKVLYELLEYDGLLVTYCAQGAFKRALKSAGFIIHAIPGPPGKREMTVANKKQSS